MSSSFKRREILQYFQNPSGVHVQRLQRLAWLPLNDGFFLDFRHTIAPFAPDSPARRWDHSLFLAPPIRSHAAFALDIAGDPVKVLWHVPIFDEEMALKNAEGVDAILDRMQAIKFPWIFEDSSRPALV